METRKGVNKQPKTYTYPQTTVLRTASSPGSNLDRHGGSILNRRQQVGASLDALQVVAQVLAVAKRDILIVDAYMDMKVLTDFVPQAPSGVAVRLLADSFSTKPTALAPAATRFVQQFGSARPLDVRLSAPRLLHDRLILVDAAQVWSLTQSLKDFAARSPALVQKVDAEIAAMKVTHYEGVWASATPLPP